MIWTMVSTIPVTCHFLPLDRVAFRALGIQSDALKWSGVVWLSRDSLVLSYWDE